MANISTLSQYLDQISRLKTQQATFNDLSIQISSGKKTQKLSGLGNDIPQTIRARTDVKSLEIYIENIKAADRRMKLMETAIGEIKKQSDSIANSFTIAMQEGDYPELETIQQLATNIYDFVLDIINQKDGDRYLFSGSDFNEPPITDTGLFSSALGEFLPDESDLTNPPLVASGLIGDWGDGTITTDEFIAAYQGTSDTVLGFSNTLTSGDPGKTFVRVDDNAEFDYTTIANKTSMREIVKVLGILKELPPVEYAPGALNDPTATTLAGDTAPFPPREKQDNFYQVIRDLSTTLNRAVDDLDKELYNLSQVRAQISIVKTAHTEQINTYKDIIGEAEDVDINEASAKILQMQTQLQASYEVTVLASQLTLANFLR